MGKKQEGNTGRGGGDHWFGVETIDQSLNGQQWKSDDTKETRFSHSENPRPANTPNKEMSSDKSSSFHAKKVKPKAKKECFQNSNILEMKGNADYTARKEGQDRRTGAISMLAKERENRELINMGHSIAMQ